MFKYVLFLFKIPSLRLVFLSNFILFFNDIVIVFILSNLIHLIHFLLADYFFFLVFYSSFKSFYYMSCFAFAFGARDRFLRSVVCLFIQSRFSFDKHCFSCLFSWLHHGIRAGFPELCSFTSLTVTTTLLPFTKSTRPLSKIVPIFCTSSCWI